MTILISKSSLSFNLNLSILDIFAFSSNIGISKIVDGLDNIDIYKLCKDFGFGAKTGLPFVKGK